MELRNLVPSNFAILAGGFYRMTADLRCMLSDAGIRSEQPGCGYPIPEIGTERAGGRYPALFAWPVLVTWIAETPVMFSSSAIPYNDMIKLDEPAYRRVERMWVGVCITACFVASPGKC